MSDYEAQRKAFEAFMLGGKKAPVPTTPSPRVSPSIPSPRTSSARTPQKRLSAAVAAFEGRVKDWIAVDDHLYVVFQSIANLRERLAITSRCLASLEDEPSITEWKQFGYRPVVRLTREDLELTLDDELLQHEKMMVEARRAVSQMAEDQEALGRRLDELLAMDEGTESVEECRQLAASMAGELYRKQTLADDVLVSADDSLFGGYADGDGEGSLRAARRCVSRWPRSHKDSNLRDHVELLQSILQKQMRNDDCN